MVHILRSPQAVLAVFDDLAHAVTIAQQWAAQDRRVLVVESWGLTGHVHPQDPAGCYRHTIVDHTGAVVLVDTSPGRPL